MTSRGCILDQEGISPDMFATDYCDDDVVLPPSGTVDSHHQSPSPEVSEYVNMQYQIDFSDISDDENGLNFLTRDVHSTPTSFRQIPPCNLDLSTLAGANHGHLSDHNSVSNRFPYSQ